MRISGVGSSPGSAGGAGLFVPGDELVHRKGSDGSTDEIQRQILDRAETNARLADVISLAGGPVLLLEGRCGFLIRIDAG